MPEKYIDLAVKHSELRQRKRKKRLIFFAFVFVFALTVLIIKWLTPNDIREYPYAPKQIFCSEAAIVEKYRGEPMYIRGNIITYDQYEDGYIEMLVSTNKGDIYLTRNMELSLFSSDFVPQVTGECNIFFVYQGWDDAEKRVYGNYLGVSLEQGEIFDGFAAYKEVSVHFYVPPESQYEIPVTPTPSP